MRISQRTGRNTAVSAGPGTWALLIIGLACVLAVVGLWVLIIVAGVVLARLFELAVRAGIAFVRGYRRGRRAKKESP